MTKICRCSKQKGEERSELERRVREASLKAMSMRPVPTKPEKVEKRVGGSQFITAFLSSAIILLMLATSWLAYNKFHGNDMGHNPIVVLPDDSHDSVKTDFLTKHEAETMMTQIQERIDNLENQMQVWNHRAWLLALAVNENANIAQDVDNRYHRCHNHQGYIVFDKSWKLNRHPDSMHLTPEQMDALNDSVK